MNTNRTIGSRRLAAVTCAVAIGLAVQTAAFGAGQAVPSNANDGDLPRQVEVVEGNLDGVAKCGLEVDRKADEMLRSFAGAQRALTDRLTGLETAVSAGEKVVAELEKRIHELQEALNASKQLAGGDVEALETQLAAVKKECEECKRKADALHAKEANSGDSPVPDGRVKKVDTIPVIILKDRVIPFNFDNYSGTRYGNFAKLTRRNDGEPIEKALAENGCLAVLLDEAARTGKTIGFAVYPDSIKAFRRAALAVQSRGLEYTWLPEVNDPIYVSLDADSGGSLVVNGGAP